MSAQARKANAGLDLTGKTAVITGGSQGIGAGIAIRFAQAGAQIIVVGRNQERLEAVISAARKVAKSTTQKFEYISVDLSLISGTKTAAREIEAKSQSKVDYLIQTQGGMPNGLYEPTTEGIDSHFAVQVLNRFLLTYMLASSGTLHDTSVSIMAPGGTQKTFDASDMELTSSQNAAHYALMAKQISRDSVITDTYTKALQSSFPKLHLFHLAPGLVQTHVAQNQRVPWLARTLFTWVVLPTVGDTVENYAEVPVFWAANLKREEAVKKEGFFLDQKGKRVEVSPFALDKGNQSAVFEKLREYLEKYEA
jgi:NAD(P)-dependent dehydrogenase (short-subunit alcohol dehydrogenase family)